MTYHEQLAETTDGTTAQVLAALAMYEAGDLPTEEFAAVVAAYVAAGNARAAALADLSLASVLTLEAGEPVAPLGITRPESDPDRLAKAASTLLAVEGSRERWERLARSEPRTAAAEAYSEGIRRSPRVSGWRRGVSGGACELCTWWSRDGRVWQADHPMPTHPGCTCVPLPVTTTTSNYQTTRQAADRARERSDQ